MNRQKVIHELLNLIVGFAVIALISIFGVLAVVALPLFLILGFFMKLVVGLLFLLFLVWLVGKLTMMLIGYLVRKNPAPKR
ncbi:MAG: hypothetical protein NC930_07310 [Candidatus Omnitrophica bacterium]|nr:hypothetical protein [Candidatus Omnitrophota bacterium]